MDCLLLLHVSENDFVPEKFVTNRLYMGEYENYGSMKIPLCLKLLPNGLRQFGSNSGILKKFSQFFA